MSRQGSNRHDTVSDVALFLQQQYPTHEKNVEVVCCSSHSATVSNQDASYTRLAIHGLDLSIDGTPVTTWPQKTDKLCAHCSHNFDWVPLCIPEKYDLNLAMYYVHSIICSVPCGVAYIKSKKHYDQWTRMALFRKMLQEVFHMRNVKLIEAPPKDFLAAFGGHQSIQEFRLTAQKTITQITSPPFLLYPIFLEEHARHKRGNLTQVTILEQDNAYASKLSSLKENADSDASKKCRTMGHQLRGLLRPKDIPKITPVSDIPCSGGLFKDFILTKKQEGKKIQSEDNKKNTEECTRSKNILAEELGLEKNKACDKKSSTGEANKKGTRLKRKKRMREETSCANLSAYMM
jgi:hypothetical protein